MYFNIFYNFFLMLISAYKNNSIEAGCDEAGRGSLAGPVFAAAVILPANANIPYLNDSKKLTEKRRYELRAIIEKEATCWAIGRVSNKEIDRINILNASILAMHKAINKLLIKPNLLLIDGNRFKPYKNIEHYCIVNGDSKFASIAAASILAKTYRDDFMKKIHKQHPVYGWNKNKGYATQYHIDAIREHAYSDYHRKSFHLKSDQLSINF